MAIGPTAEACALPAANVSSKGVTSKQEERRVKLQHFLVLKAFNLRLPHQSVQQQFQFLRQRDPSAQVNQSIAMCLRPSLF